MKKLLVLFLAAAMSLSLLAGCGNSDSGSSSKNVDPAKLADDVLAALALSLALSLAGYLL